MPDSGYRSSNTSARTHASVSTYRQVSTAPNNNGGDFLTTRSALPGTASKLHSSNLLASSSKLKAPTKMDAEKMLHRSLTSNASTGGNGIRRPYGRFIASRGGLALSVWERQAPGNSVAAIRASRESRRSMTVSSPYFPQVKTAGASGSSAKATVGRNVSRYNVRRKAYTSRNMDISSKSVESKYSFQGTDTINYSNSTIIDVPLFSRPRPEGMSTLGAERSSSSLLGGGYSRSSYKQLPAATFLTHIPTLPRAVRVDCGQSCAKEFLTRSPHAAAERGHGDFSSASGSSAYLGGGLSAAESSSVGGPNLSSKSLRSLSSLGLPEVLSGALSLNINQLNNHDHHRFPGAAHGMIHLSPNKHHAAAFSLMSTM